ncbi:MAG: SpoIIE family protein phosphatase [Leptospira sp.]|nr:SpoIIE family protein phosphatase [Leptospira sp.]
MACLLCGEIRIPDGHTVASGKFHCNTCGKEWFLEKRKIQRFPRLHTSKGISDLILEFISLFNSSQDIEDLLTRVVSIICTKLSVENVGILFLEEDLNHLRMAKFMNGNTGVIDSLNKFRVKFDRAYGPVAACLLDKKSMYYQLEDQTAKNYYTYKRIAKISTQLAIPIVFRGTPLGVIFIDYKKFDEKKIKQDLYLLELVAGQFAAAVRNTLLFERTKRQSRNFQNLHIAGLTLSRLYFDNTLEMIKMILLTLSGFVDTDINILNENNNSLSSVTAHKLLRSATTIDISTDEVDKNEYHRFEEIFKYDESIVVSSEKFQILKNIGFERDQVLIIPLFKGEGNDYIFMIGRRSDTGFTSDDIEVLSAYSAQAKITIENSVLYQKMAKQQRFEKEIEIAREIQYALLPKSMPTHPRYEFGGFMIPARGIGGDYYDIIVSPNTNETLICIGDVSGKGIPAGLVMATVRTIIHSLVRKKYSTWDIAHDVNTYIYHNYRDSALPRFMSIIVLRWDSTTNEFQFSGGGHGDLLIYRAAEKKIEIIATKGIILGVKPDISEYFNMGRIDMNVGDVMLMFTDGVTEAMNKHGEQFDEERLRNTFMKNSELHPEEMLSKIYADLKIHTDNFEQNDDITLLAVKRFN